MTNQPEPEIARGYLHDQAAQRLRALIVSGELAPKARVNELELAERFGISRTPMREAIKILATEGLLELLPNRGARIVSISAVELNEMIEVVAGLEATAGDLACRMITDNEVAAIRCVHNQMVEAWRKGDEGEYLTLNRRIHEALMRASRNTMLQNIYSNVSGRIQRARYTAHKTPEQWQKAIDEHERILALLDNRDSEALSRLMREHVRGKIPIIAAAYGEQAMQG